MFKLIQVIIFVAVIWLIFIFFNGNGQVEDQAFIIASGQGVNQISRNLYSAGLIKNKLVFETWVWLKKAEGKIVAGSYTIPADISIKGLTELLLSGPNGQDNTLTIIEGWNRQSEKFLEILGAKGFAVDQWLALTADKADWEGEYEFLADAPVGASLEGYIFPDTYSFDSADVNSLIVKTLDNFDRKLTEEMRQEIKRQNKTIFEVITLASIIEREASQRDKDSLDDNMVADVFWKRLAINMPLQSDATVNFVTGKSLTRPTLADLEIDSPYNTYKYAGLPPGPIASPGLSSIEAAIYPKANPYYYFLTTEEGEFIYAENHDQHVANKAKYLD